MAMADLLVQDQPIDDDDVPDTEGESSEMDTLIRGGAMPSVPQTRSGKAVLLGKDSIHKARALLQDDKEKATHLRFLVSNRAAGCILGKGGSTINDFQSQSGARIQLSCSHEFLPGTNDRIIMVSGLFDEVVKATELVLERLLSEGEESNEAEATPEFKLLVPNSSCGGIIGKGGETIKSFIEDSHAGIKISPQDNNFVGLHDRVVTITGPLNSQMRAIYLILSKLSEDVHYPPNLSSPFPYAGLGFPGHPAAVPAGYIIPQVPCDAVNYGPNGYAGDGGGRYQNNKPAATMAAAPLPALPDDLIEEILLRLPPDDPASLLCASLVCKTWSHIAKVKLKRSLLQLQLERAQLLQLLENAQLLLLKSAQLQEEHNQLQKEVNQLLQRLVGSSSRAPSSRRRSASSRGGQPAAAQARPAWC